MIDIEKSDFGILCICALRYCYGRDTYMPGLVRGIVKSHFKDLEGRDLRTISRDIIDMDFWRDSIHWGEFREEVRVYMEGKHE